MNKHILLFKNEINIVYYENIHSKKTHDKNLEISENKDNPVVSIIKERLVKKKCEIDTLNPKKWELSKKC